ncbi:MAG: aspartate aminotransferase family protein [Bacteroidetes bacterium]|nr:aspartate aminotransferase family protein [Bacteroidota bacterium]
MPLSNRQLFLMHNAQTSTSPLMLEAERAEGSFIYDTSGKQYIDLISGISVSNVGHRHPKVIAAITSQLEKYMHLMVYGEYIQTPQVALATFLNKLLEKHFEHPVSSFFTNSGTEAVEGAMKLAKRYTGRHNFVAFKNAYHGHTQGAMSLMNDEVYRKKFSPLLPGVAFLDYNSTEGIDSINEKTAAVFIEIVQSETGYTVGHNDFLETIYNRCKETGALLIIDEIQTGCGRTGSMFAFEQTKAKPDILLLAKGIGGGMPIGAFIARSYVMNALSHQPILGHLTTFGGHPVCCASALATLMIIEEESLDKQAIEKGIFIKEYIYSNLQITTEGKGMMQSLAFKDFDTCKAVIDECLVRGVLTDWFLFAPNKLRISPPLNIEMQTLKEALDIIIDIINKTK